MVLSQQAQNAAKNDAALDYQPVVQTITEPSGLATPISENQMAPVPLPVPALLVSNLPSVLFSQVTDLHPLLCPFGEIVGLRIVSENTADGTVVVFVEYKTASQAKEARAALSGQRYHSQPVGVEFVQPSSPSPIEPDFDLWSSCKFNMKTGLNPLAAPFFAESVYASQQVVPSLRDYPLNLRCADGNNIASIVTRNSSPFMEATNLRSNMSSASGFYGMPFLTHRPHSAPSE